MLDEDGYNITPCSEETIVRMGFYDAAGAAHHSITRTSRGLLPADPASIALIKEAATAYGNVLGYTLFFLQLSVEHIKPLSEPVKPFRLTLVNTVDRRQKPRNSGFGGL